MSEWHDRCRIRAAEQLFHFEGYAFGPSQFLPLIRALVLAVDIKEVILLLYN